MLTINEVIYSLSSKQNKIIIKETDNKKQDIYCHNSMYNRYIVSNNYDTKELYLCIKDIIGDSFYIYKSIFKDSFIESILYILSNKFLLSQKKYKKKYIIDFRKKISFDLTEQNLYNKFKYNKNRNIKKSRLQKVLLDINTPIYNDDIAFQLIADYLDINIFIFFVSTYLTLDSVYVYYSRVDVNKFCIFKPTVFLCNKNNKYNSIMSNKDNIVLYSKKSTLLDSLYKTYVKDNIENYKSDEELSKVDTKEEQVKEESAKEEHVKEESAKEEHVKEEHAKEESAKEEHVKVESEKKSGNKTISTKMNLAKLRKLAIEHNIDIYKTSEKTKKQIYKNKKDLVYNLINI